jgi:hypothetical protein
MFHAWVEGVIVRATSRTMKYLLSAVALASANLFPFALSTPTKYEVPLVQHGQVVILQADSAPPILSPPAQNSTKYFRKCHYLQESALHSNLRQTNLAEPTF